MKKILNFFAILSTALFLAACGSSGPESVAESFVKNLYEGSASDAMKLVHIPEKDNSKELDEALTGKLEASINQNKRKIERAGGLSGYQTLEAVMKDDSNAQVKVIVTFSDKTTEIEQVHVVKINGDWKVQI